MSFLSGRKFLIVGGNGFVGNRIAAKLIQHSAQVSVLSRRGPKYQYPENKKINWMIGDAMEPQPLKDKINQADTIIHSMAALIDTSVTKFKAPGEQGTYEQMNRDSFKKILSMLESPKRIIYISAMGHPPFLSRYQSTKKQSQDILLNTQHDGYAIRPGFIYDWKLKRWSIPMRYVIKGWNQMYNPLHSFARNGTILQNFISQFQQSQPTSLDKIAQSIAYIGLNGYNKKILQNEDLKKISEEYEKLVEEERKGEIKQN